MSRVSWYEISHLPKNSQKDFFSFLQSHFQAMNHFINDGNWEKKLFWEYFIFEKTLLLVNYYCRPHS